MGRIGVYICHCGVNISSVVDVQAVASAASHHRGVTVARDYKFMCSEPGQALIQRDIQDYYLDRVVVASCSPHMHELTFRIACEEGGLNRYLFQMANIREHCAWIHSDRDQATEKAKALVKGAIRRVTWQEPLEAELAEINPATLVVGAGIAGIHASLEIAGSGNPVYLVERESTIGGHMAQFDKTFPTLDCAACILTPKMVAVRHRRNIRLLTLSQVEKVEGHIGNFTVTVRTKARYVGENCTACGECTKVCPVEVPDSFDEQQGKRRAIYKAFPQAVPNSYVIDKQQVAPCVEACPIRQEAAGYTALIKERRFGEAADLIRMRNPLPTICGRVCYHPCEDACNRRYVDEPVAIRHLKRFALDWAREHGRTPEPSRISATEGKVAVIGSGPAGLACAHDLALSGYRVTVFEKLPTLGGMLSVGVPQYRLPRRLLQEELDYLGKLGIEFVTNTEIGKDLYLDTLREEGYKAIFIASGAHDSAKLGIPGEECEGVVYGVDFLKRVSLRGRLDIGRRVAVIGGGNTALDAARTALRLGAKRVSVLYRRSRAEMPATPEEIEEAEREGIAFNHLVSPVKISRVRGSLALDCVKNQLGERDESGRRKSLPVRGSEHRKTFDTVIVAISQRPEKTGLRCPEGGVMLDLTPWGTIKVDKESFQTSVAGIFAGGDAVTGPSTVIAAVGSGRRAAEAIVKYLRAEPLKGFKTHMPGVLGPWRATSRPHSCAPMLKDIPKQKRVEVPKLPPGERVKGFEEVELGLSEEEAVREAKRCLSCGVCVECLSCAKVCEAGAIDYNMGEMVEKIHVGQVLLTTGYDIFDARAASQFGYGKLENVLSSLEFERMLSSTGSTAGKILCKNGNPPRAIGIIHCIGSRDENYHKYCSRVCCMYALKFAHLVRDRSSAEVYQFYIDMRAYGKGFEEFYKRVLLEGTNVIRGKVAEVVESEWALRGEGHLIIRCEDTLISKYREIPVDMVILCNAIEPRSDAQKLGRLFSLALSPDGFFLERHPKLDPTGTMNEGIYIAGCCQGPKDIPDTVAQSAGAAARILATISRGKVELDPIRAEIKEELCSGCRVCNSVCPYSSISFDERRRISIISTALCKGCGACVAACPAGAITARGFTDRQIMAEIEGVLA